MSRYTCLPPARFLIAACAVTLLASCSDPTVPPSELRTTEQLHFLRTRLDAPPLSSSMASFYAKRGSDRGVALYYRPRAGSKDSTRLLDFRVPSGSLAQRPDGRPFAAGDSVLITIRVTDPTRMIIAFEPSGLRFSSASPAQLELSFSNADDDVNDDGDVDVQDEEARTMLSVWVQEAPGGLWAKVKSALFLDLRELQGGIAGFSGYAAAY
ncbi:hypothetical protein BH11GEM1_BH11GEM1_02350 [soil metagenome]